MCVYFHLSICTCATDRNLRDYDLNEFRWKRKEGHVSPIWMTHPEALEACMGLVKYGCKYRFSAQCNCKQLDLRCTHLSMGSGVCKEENDHLF